MGASCAHVVCFLVVDLDVCVDELGVVVVGHLELLDCAHTYGRSRSTYTPLVQASLLRQSSAYKSPNQWRIANPVDGAEREGGAPGMSCPSIGTAATTCSAGHAARPHATAGKFASEVRCCAVRRCRRTLTAPFMLLRKAPVPVSVPHVPVLATKCVTLPSVCTEHGA